MEWTTALPDWESRIVAGDSLMPCEPLFADEAEEGARYFGDLRAVDVLGSPTLGEIARPWVMDWVRSIFGAYDPESSRRLIREWFLLVSKKNGKSTMAAGVMMTALLLNWRKSGEFGILAPTMEVANNAFHPARDMVKADEELSRLLLVQDHYRKITHRTTGATLQVVAADSEAVAGKKWTGTFVDELWLFGKRAGANKMLEEATGGMASRPEGFVIYASTQADEQPAGVFKEKLAYARGVRDGRIDDPQFLPLLYEYPRPMLESEAYLDRRYFFVTNPNLGASVDETFIARKLTQSGEAGAESRQTVLAKYLNVEIGLALAGDRWVGAEVWEGAGIDRFTLEELIERCEAVTVGIDGGGRDDLLGLAVVGRVRDSRDWLAWGHAWAHRSVLERHRLQADRLRGFADDGDLTIIERTGEDVDAVATIVEMLDQAPRLDKVGVDAHGLGGILDALEARGIRRERIIAIPQGWKLIGAIKTTERRLSVASERKVRDGSNVIGLPVEGALRHAGQGLLGWCIGNARVELHGNAISITKERASGKIDPVMALFNAVALMALNPPAVDQRYAIGFA